MSNRTDSISDAVLLVRLVAREQWADATALIENFSPADCASVAGTLAGAFAHFVPDVDAVLDQMLLAVEHETKGDDR
ncbi:MAG: hypothetical protein FWF90_05030 [Promicromonosporaceae bacterium]|nr:hypothetical protein [Promicromonosporaceae bacterium]